MLKNIGNCAKCGKTLEGNEVCNCSNKEYDKDLRVKMNLKKDAPVYYKVQLRKLLEQAKKHGLKIIEKNGRIGFVYETNVCNMVRREQASVNIKDYE